MLDAILAWPNLCDAWERVAGNQGAPGPDRVSVRRFARNWETNLQRLQNQLRTQTYRPGRLRRVAVPKRGGGQRLLRIANIGDRVAQRAVLNVLDDHFERRFYACSYGYRPGRSLHGALRAILRFRDQGLMWVLDADIDNCFDSVDHELLRTFLEKDVPDPDARKLLDLWIDAGTIRRNPNRGLAQGMPIAPLLCNVFLHRLDKTMVRGRWAIVRYADDFIVCCASPDEAQRAYRLVEQRLDQLKLTYEPAKTCVTSFEEGFDFLGIHLTATDYSFVWQEKRFTVEGATPGWLWRYTPDGYE
ncbi:MAG: hypothetical protein KDD92_04755 [Caldilineaceae bacterium]|nr:hypothetical protein [Caldilineaceae bacterium]